MPMSAAEVKCKIRQHDNDLAEIYGMLAGISGTQVRHGHRLDELGRKLDEHDARFDTIDGRLDSHDARFDTVESKLDEVLQILRHRP